MHLKIAGAAVALVALFGAFAPHGEASQVTSYRVPRATPTPYNFPQLTIAQGPIKVATVLVVPQAVVTPTPSPTPTATPTPGGCSNTNYANIVNGAEFPSNYCPFTQPPGGVNYGPLPASPSFVDTTNTPIFQSQYVGVDQTEFYAIANDGNDFSPAIYYCSASDPSCVTVNLNCGGYGGGCGTGVPSTMRIPAKARAPVSSDGPLGVIQANGDEIMVYKAGGNTGDWVAGNTVTSGFGAVKTNVTTGNGWITGTNAGAASDGEAYGASQIYFREMRAGVIKHSLFLVVPCVSSGITFPATSAGHACTSGGVPIGSHVHLKLTDAQIAALPNSTADANMKIILTALHDYGGVINETGCFLQNTPTSPCINFEGASQYVAYGNQSPGVAFAATYGWSCNGSTCSDPQKIPWATLGASNWEILQSCYIAGTCST